MVDPAADKATPRTAADDAAIRNLIERLAKQFPDLSSADVRQAVCGTYDVYRHSKIRDFVPILVERAARRELDDTHGHPHPA